MKVGVATGKLARWDAVPPGRVSIVFKKKRRSIYEQRLVER
jgi:hypothetical protein